MGVKYVLDKDAYDPIEMLIILKEETQFFFMDPYPPAYDI